jgi:hypothetical protein
MCALCYCGVNGDTESGQWRHHPASNISSCRLINCEHRTIVMLLFTLMRHDPGFGRWRNSSSLPMMLTPQSCNGPTAMASLGRSCSHREDNGRRGIKRVFKRPIIDIQQQQLFRQDGHRRSSKIIFRRNQDSSTSGNHFPQPNRHDDSSLFACPLSCTHHQCYQTRHFSKIFWWRRNGPRRRFDLV